ncbi:hypothetical protein BR93DRAFT_963127 [Coniochaeta sp. PMI_546]|nr:hypothetical protein BR93DRAFT_963127 [Coniochaeta sp. PMI_546]
MLVLSLLALLPLASAAGVCNADNCLRAIQNTARLASASSFCASFTATSVPASQSSVIPSYLANCGGSVDKVSSACACQFPTPTSTSSSSTSTSTSSSSTSTSTISSCLASTAYVTVPTTVTVPGEEEVVTVTVPTTVSLPGDQTTVTVPTTVTLPGEETTSTVTVPGEEEVVTVTVPTTVTLPGDQTTVTVPTTVTLPGEEEVVTVTVPTTVTLPGDQTTATSTSFVSCPSATQVVKNPSFETSSDWIMQSNPAIGSGLIRGNPGSANPAADGAAIVQSAIDRVLNAHEGHRLQQAVRVCPGAQYRVSVQLRTISASAADRPTTATVYVNGAVAIQSAAVTVAQGWVQFSNTWTAGAAVDAALVQISLSCAAPVSSAAWSYLWIDNVTLTKV